MWKFFTKRDWRLVKKVDEAYVIINKTSKRTEKDNCILSYYLYENQFHDRKFDVVDSEEGDLDLGRVPKSHWTFRSPTYREKIRPWLDGRLDPEIPTYEQVPKDDFQNALAGKKVK